MNAYNYEEQLNELFEDQDEVRRVQNDEYFSIKDLQTALWADGILYEKEQKIAQIKSIFNERKDKMLLKLEEWLKQSLAPLEKDVEFFETHLKVYQANLIAEERANKVKKESKTIKLAYRDLKVAKQQPEIIKDDEKLLEWVEKNHSENIPTDIIEKLIVEKAENEESQITVTELLNIVKQYDSTYIKRDPKLTWGELKKTLKQDRVNVTITGEDGTESVVGTRLAYFDEYGQEVPHVELVEREEEYTVKAKV